MSKPAVNRPAATEINLRFLPAALEAIGEYDVIMAYEFFLGRPPEEAGVITRHQSQGFRRMVTTFMGSPEFATKVIRPLRSGQPVVRGDYRSRPSTEQADWFSGYVELTGDQATALGDAGDWTAYFRALCTVAGIELAGGETIADTTAATSAGAPDDPRGGIERIALQLEQIRVMLADVTTAIRALRG